MFKNSLELTEKYQNALIFAGMGLWELNIATRQITWDEGYRRLLQKDQGQYEGHLNEELDNIYEEDRDRLRIYLKKILSDDSDISVFFRVYTKKKEIKYIRTSAHRVKKDDKLVSIVGINWDVTAESLLRSEIGMTEDFAEIILKDSMRIQNSLIEQSKMASLGEMASEMAHEVNNPLMIIMGKSQLLQDKISTPNFDIVSCQSDLMQIEINCLRIDKLIKSLKSISRKADQDPFEDVSVFKLIDEAIEICKERFRKKRLNLYVRSDPIIDYTFTTKARPSEIVQVLVNLLNNSYDAICNQDRGWIRINVSLAYEIYNIEVVDSGAKIEADVAKKMMSPFFTTKPTGKGTGLGLSVSKQIIENHYGELYYDPNGDNTRFVFTLPKS